MLFGSKRNCVSETSGTITKVRFNNNDSRRVFVEYIVDGKSYTLKENVTVRSVIVKAGDIPVGQKKIEYITAGVGDTVAVKYNPNNPKQAYLRDNIGAYV